MLRRSRKFLFVVVAATLMLAGGGHALAADIGVVVLHGKGGMPGGLVKSLALHLSRSGMDVANLEMPWSRDREYGAAPEAGVGEIDAAFEKMRADGAKKVFVVGHSLGALFAAHYAAERAVSGLVLVAPGGNVASRFWQDKVSDSLDKAARLIDEGKGEEKTDFIDFEGSKGNSTIHVTPTLYRAWFSTDSPLNQRRTYGRLPAGLPVLNIVPVNDYKALVRAKDDLFRLLPDTPDREMYEPHTNHQNAPAESAEKITAWIERVAKS
ncbi:MAG: alpha/beta fold hydrolase [Rhodospirillales bacterium]|nr:alpha/beta fold hydrolase [Rhodospirillales bacterium]MBO6787176.1 alpha/beta fold hydrolase [Rhodospirillales bacterium]